MARAAVNADDPALVLAGQEWTRMDERELRDVLDFAVDAAHLAGTFTLGHFSGATPFEMKTDNTPVSQADRGAEERLRQRIEAAFPADGIVGEEFGEQRGHSPARWILDPIDGTVSFISGVPLYSVLIGYEWNREMLAGVIHLPALHETVCAARGLGCRWNGRPAQVSGISDLAQARLVTTSTKLLYQHGRGPAYERLRAACYTDRGWSDAYGYALLATGRVEIVLDPVVSIWDIAPLVPIVTEAGGTLTDWCGRPTHTAPAAVATNGRLFEQVMAKVRGG
jgi:histidinol phosphatase-like enzyme (inositol monophosphatase family)